MKKIILPLLCLCLTVGCTPHGKWSPYSAFKRGAAFELQEASRQATLAKSSQQALAYYEAVYNKHRDDEKVAVSYAQALRQAGFAQRSIRVLEPYYMDRDVSQETVLEYVKAYISSGQFQEAETLLKKRIKLDAREQEKEAIQAYLGAVRYARVHKIIEPERPDFSALKGNPQFHNLLGVIYDAQGKPEKAEVELRDALNRWDGERGIVENNLALCLANQGKVEEAMTIISKAFVEAPDRPQVARNLEIINRLYKDQAK